MIPANLYAARQQETPPRDDAYSRLSAASQWVAGGGGNLSTTACYLVCAVGGRIGTDNPYRCLWFSLDALNERLSPGSLAKLQITH